MDDLIYRHEAIAALGERPTVFIGSAYEIGSRNRFDMDRLAIDTVHPVDAVEVVRCKDCKRYQHEVGDDEYALGWCPFLTIHLVSRDGFCAWGKRKEDGNAAD